jgi:hypothetical protein
LSLSMPMPSPAPAAIILLAIPSWSCNLFSGLDRQMNSIDSIWFVGITAQFCADIEFFDTPYLHSLLSLTGCAWHTYEIDWVYPNSLNRLLSMSRLWPAEVWRCF